MTPTSSVCTHEDIQQPGPDETVVIDVEDTEYYKAVQQQKHYLPRQSITSQVVLDPNSLTNITYSGGMEVAESQEHQSSRSEGNLVTQLLMPEE